LNLPEAVSNLKTLIKACMDHKFGITTGGHNIMIDVIENDVSASCLTLASNLIKDETTRFTKARTQGGFVPRDAAPGCNGSARRQGIGAGTEKTPSVAPATLARLKTLAARNDFSYR